MREALGRPQWSIAARAGISQGHLSQLERGLFDPGVDVAVGLAAALGMSIEELLLEVRYRIPGRHRKEKLNRHKHAIYGEYAALPVRARRLVRELMGMLRASSQ